MTKSRDHFREFQPHSRHKHLILEHYFLAWGHKLGMRVGAGDRILYVDACAGRGQDDLGNDGSPLIAARAAAVAQENVSERRRSPFRIQVVAIEPNRSHHAALEALLAPFKKGVRTVLGTLEDQLNPLESEFPETPSLYFIDPFGLEPLNGGLVRRALSGQQHEALLLFADQSALRHFGVISTKETRAERRHKSAVRGKHSQRSLFDDVNQANEEHVAALAKAAGHSRAAINLSRPSSIRILNAAFDNETWLPAIEAAPKDDRRATFLRLYCDRLRDWGATHVLQIPVMDSDGVRAYTLIHASKSAKAFRAMKEAVGHALKNSPLAPEVVETMRDLIRVDTDAIVSAVLQRFAGNTVRWAEDPRNTQIPSVRRFVLEETEAFPFDAPELQAGLLPYKLSGRAIAYSFPESSANVDQDRVD
jgi:three-Cys-motif partner protein